VDREAIVEAYRRGERVSDIAARFGVRPEYVTRCARAFGVPLHKPRREYTQEFRQKVLALYANGMAQDAIRLLYEGCNVALSRKWLRAREIIVGESGS